MSEVSYHAVPERTFMRRFRPYATLGEEEVGTRAKVNEREGVGVQGSDLYLGDEVHLI